MFTLLLMISFASVNAVLYTPALPGIAQFFAITEDKAQLTITWFLIGYALGQLIYGPVANRFGRKPALYVGILLQILSCLACVVAGYIVNYPLLIIARFTLALGAGVGLKMTYTLINECYDPQVAAKKIAYIVLAFAITPALSVAVGGVLTARFGWISCFYALALYGVVLLILVSQLTETKVELDKDALKLPCLLQGYAQQFKNATLLAGGLLMGSCTSFVYVFAAVAPFIAINSLGMESAQYGLANLLPSLGLIAGSLGSTKLIHKWSLSKLVRSGIVLAMLGAMLMGIATYLHLKPMYVLFWPMTIIYCGASLIIANASALAMSAVSDKAHGSAVMSFINMGLATLLVLLLGYFSIQPFLLPCVYFALCIAMVCVARLLLNPVVK